MRRRRGNYLVGNNNKTGRQPAGASQAHIIGGLPCPDTQASTGVRFV